MNNPVCENCGGRTEINVDNDYECSYCGCTTDENGSVIYEIQSM